MTNREGDLRILGARDGYASALIHLRLQIIAPIDGQYSRGIHPRHSRKLAARQAKLEPLRELEGWLLRVLSETQDAWVKSCRAVGEEAKP